MAFLSKMFTFFAERSWIEQGYKVGEQVIPLARFKHTDVESGKVLLLHSIITTLFLIFLVVICFVLFERSVLSTAKFYIVLLLI
jgi:hypothetical protein